MAVYLPHTEPHLIFRAANALIFLLIVFFGMVFIAIPPLRIPTAILFVTLCWGTWRFAYVNTRYSTHCIIMQAVPLAIFLVLSTLLVAGLARKELGWSLPSSVALACLPMLLVISACGWAWSMRLSQSPYQFRKGRVYPIAHDSNGRAVSPLWIGAGVGAMSIISPYIVNHATPSYVMAGVLLLCLLVIIWYGRYNIAGLRYLRARERSEGVAYAFGNLEDLQAARAGKWTARVFIALDSALIRLLRKLGARLAK